jgi:acetyl-CoA C-acetyltransferase
MPSSPLAVILSACRTPIGSFGGALKDLSAVDLGAVVVRDVIGRAGVPLDTIGDVVLGCVLQGAAGMNVARQAAVKAGVPLDVPAETINRVCGSGLQAVVHAVEAVRMGYTDVVVAGGTESMSNAPFALTGSRWGYRMGHAQAVDTMIHDGLTDAMHLCHMGMTAEEVATRHHVSREDQDRFAAESQRRAAEAIAAGAFTDEIVAVPVPQRKGNPILVDTDEYPRATTAEKLAALKPAFSKDGSVTAGNSSGINDGAAATLVCSIEHARSRETDGLARILGYASIGVDPLIMGMGPVPAVRKALARAGLDLADIDLFELNEAFAAQALAVVRELGIETDKVNVHGGAIALGHPIGASGARVLTTLIHALRKRGGGRGVASLCIGGGMGIAMVIDV